MFNIQTLNKISPSGLAMLDEKKYNVGNDVANPDAILVRSAKMHDMEYPEELLCIGRAGAGVNNIPVDACADHGVVVFNTPGANAAAVKELAICALFLASRDVVGGIQWAKTIADQGDDIPALVEKGKGAFGGPEIQGKTLGVIGLGAIGARIAHDAIDLGMKVYGYDPYLSVDAAWHLSSRVLHAADLDEIYAKCDYITIHVPYLPTTKHTLNKDAFAKMKDGVRILNLARGELVCDEDMVAALESGKVARYVTDFPNKTVLNAKNVIAIPHLGASTPESEDNCAVMAARQIADYLENGNIVNSVNIPSATMPRSGAARVCVIHQNIPEMLAKITTTLSSKGANIENMQNAGRKGKPYAYTIVDVDETHEGLKEALMAIEGVIRVRVI